MIVTAILLAPPIYMCVCLCVCVCVCREILTMIKQRKLHNRFVIGKKILKMSESKYELKENI